MDYQKKLNIVESNPNTRTLWHIVLILLFLDLLLSIYKTYTTLGAVGLPIVLDLIGLLQIFILSIIAVLLILKLLVVWGVYKLKGWVLIPLWLVLIISTLNLYFIDLIISIIVLILYNKVLNKILKESEDEPIKPLGRQTSPHKID